MGVTEELINNVTLISVISNYKYLIPTLKALKYSQRMVDFKNVILFTCCQIPKLTAKNWKIIPIKPLNSLEYTEYCYSNYYKFVKTDHILTIHADGFIINPNLWRNEFLEYDYIGALWPVKHVMRWKSMFNITENNINMYRCGSGGFSLRSKRLLDICGKQLTYVQNLHDDFLISGFYREQLLSLGIKFPPPKTAVNFCIESMDIPELNTIRPKPTHKNRFAIPSFGFHNKYSDALNFLKYEQI